MFNVLSGVFCAVAALGFALVLGHDCEMEHGIEPNLEDDSCESFWECHDYEGVKRKCHGADQFHFQLNKCLPNKDVWCQWQYIQLEQKEHMRESTSHPRSRVTHMHHQVPSQAFERHGKGRGQGRRRVAVGGYVCRSEYGHEPDLRDMECMSFWRCDEYMGSKVTCEPGLIYDIKAKACRGRAHVNCHQQLHDYVKYKPKHRVVLEKKDNGVVVVHHLHEDTSHHHHQHDQHHQHHQHDQHHQQHHHMNDHPSSGWNNDEPPIYYYQDVEGHSVDGGYYVEYPDYEQFYRDSNMDPHFLGGHGGGSDSDINYGLTEGDGGLTIVHHHYHDGAPEDYTIAQGQGMVSSRSRRSALNESRPVTRLPTPTSHGVTSVSLSRLFSPFSTLGALLQAAARRNKDSTTIARNSKALRDLFRASIQGQQYLTSLPGLDEVFNTNIHTKGHQHELSFADDKDEESVGSASVDEDRKDKNEEDTSGLTVFTHTHDGSTHTHMVDSEGNFRDNTGHIHPLPRYSDTWSSSSSSSSSFSSTRDGGVYSHEKLHERRYIDAAGRVHVIRRQQRQHSGNNNNNGDTRIDTESHFIENKDGSKTILKSRASNALADSNKHNIKYPTANNGDEANINTGGNSTHKAKRISKHKN